MTMDRRRIIQRRRTVMGGALVAAIAFLAGMTDAAGLLIAGSFVSFMSGNTTRAAVALAEGQTSYAIILLGALFVFIAGNALGVIFAHNSSRRTFRVLSGVTLVLGLSAAATDPDFATIQFYGIVLAMGIVNAAVEHIEGLPIGLTYVTGGLSRFGRGIGSWIVGTRRRDWTIQIVPWLGMATGGICGAFLERAMGAGVLWLICVLSATIATTVFFIPPRLQQRHAHHAAQARAKEKTRPNT